MSSNSELINILLKNVTTFSEEDVHSLIEDYNTYLRNISGYIESIGGVVKLEGRKAYIFGDIHGDINSLIAFLEKINAFKHLKNGGYLIFLGDYIDRGEYQVETINFLMLLQLQYKDKIILLRGNHEPPRWLLPYPHDFPSYLRFKYPDNWKQLYDSYLEVFQRMPHAAYSENGFFFVHGGISVNVFSLDKYRDPNKELLTEILWNDPLEGIGVKYSYRGVGYLWGEDITDQFLRENDMQLIIRGHESCNGYMWKHNHKVLTLFSRLGAPYYNDWASIVKIDLSKAHPPSESDFISISVNDLHIFSNLLL